MRKESLALLLGYLRAQRDEIKRLFYELKDIKPTDDEKTVYLAYYLHNLYCAFEDLFIEIARTFENKIEDPSRYHRELLKRMSIEVPSIRPWVITKDSYRTLDELRKFRHVFRHAYTYDIDREKVGNIKLRILSKFDSIISDINKFEEFIKERLEGE